MKQKRTSGASVKPFSTNRKIAARSRAGSIATVLVAVVVSITLWHVLVKPSGNFTVRPIPSAFPTVAASAVPGIHRVRPSESLGLVVGEQLIYTFQQKRILRIQGSSFAGIVGKETPNQAGALEVEQRGRFVVKVYKETASGWIVGFLLSQPTLRMGLRDGPEVPDGGGTALEGEILAQVQWSGRIGKIITQVPTAEEALNHWRDILARWQTVLSGNPAVAHWTTTEEDVTGTYMASYSRGTNSTSKMLTKEKQRYTALSTGPTGVGEPATEVKGSASIEMNPYPVNIEGHEELAIRTPEIGGRIDSQANYSFRLESVSTNTEVIQAAREKTRIFENARDIGWASTAGVSNPVTTVDIKETTIGEQLKQLESLLDQGLGGTVEELKTLEKIKSLVEHDDATVDSIRERLSNHKGERNEDLDAALTGMLGAAGTPKAQTALLDLASSAASPIELREKALFSFVQVTALIAESDQALEDLHQRKDDLSNTALLVYAATGDHVRDRDPERFGKISDYVTTAASDSSLNLNDRLAALEAIRNLGPNQVPVIVGNSLESEDPLVRQKAVLSLQRIPGQAAYPFFQNAILGDAEESVRAAAAKLIGETGWKDGYPDLAKVAEKDSSEVVRRAAVEALGEWGGGDEDAVRVLKSVAAHDSAQAVRDVAAQIIQSRVEIAHGEN